MPSWPLLALVSLAGALGTAARFLMIRAAILVGLGGLLGTLAVNALGCALMGALMAADGPSPEWKTVFGAGLLGGFTTYSAFNHETLTALSAGRPGLAAFNLLGTTAACLLGGLLGALAVRWLRG